MAPVKMEWPWKTCLEGVTRVVPPEFSITAPVRGFGRRCRQEVVLLAIAEESTAPSQ